MFVEVKDYADAKEKSEECFLRAEDARKDEILLRAKDSMYGNDTINYLTAIELLKEIPGWKDSDEIILKCKKKIEEILETEEADRIKQEKQSEIIRKRYEEQQKLSLAKAKRTNLFATIGLGVTAFILLLILLLNHLN